MTSNSPAARLLALLLGLASGGAWAQDPEEHPNEPPFEGEEDLPPSEEAPPGEDAPLGDELPPGVEEPPDMEVVPEGEQLPPGEAPADAEIIVYGDLEVARARQEVIRDLQDLGYREGQRQGDYVIFSPEEPWRPTVRVYDDGFVVMRRSPVRFEPPGGIDGKPLRYLWCLPPLTPMCVRIGGQTVSKRKLQHQRSDVAYAIEPEMRAWREALIGRAMAERVGVEIPAQLDALWQEGVPLNDPDAPRLPTPAQRRVAMLDFWASRTCTPEGEQVREVVELFLAWEVQSSEWPVTPEELARANAATRCEVSLSLPKPHGP